MELSTAQIATLDRLVRQAWELDSARTRAKHAELQEREGRVLTHAQARDLWRRDQLERVCGAGVRSFASLTQHDFLPVKAHLEALCRRKPRAAATLVKSQSDRWRRAWWLLEQACGERGLEFPAYPQSIFRKQSHGRALSEATEKQLFQLLYTVRNRRQAGGQRRGPAPATTASQAVGAAPALPAFAGDPRSN
jgi:hypothetical protein